MKRTYIITFLLMLLLTGCSLDSTENYKGAIIVEKGIYRNNVNNGYNVKIRVKEKDKYSIKTITICKYELRQYNIGDTIK